jgi:predicted ABC-type sugar transport system permease subunit
MQMSSNVKGIAYLVLATLIISVQNIVIKWIGGDYSVLEIVPFRSLVSLSFSTAVKATAVYPALIRVLLLSFDPGACRPSRLF